MTDVENKRAALRRLAQGMAAVSPDVAPLIRRATRIMLAMIWVLALLAAIGIGVLLVSHARSHSQANAVSLEQYARRTIDLAAFVVDEFEEFLDQRGGIDGIAVDPAASRKLGELVKWLPEGSGTLLVLPDGSVTASSTPLPDRMVNLSDRRWFKAHAEEGAESYVGPAILGRVNGDYIFTYTSAYRGQDGRLLAMVNLGIPSGSITGLAPDGHGLSFALVQHEGPVVAAQPFRPDMVGTPYPLPARPDANQETVLNRVPGSYAVSTVRDLPDLGLYAVATVPLLTALQPLIWGVGIGFPLLLLFTQLLLGLSDLLQKKSLEVQQALADNKVLFQEVHHRVKNNLQVVSSLLRLQTERLPPEVRPVMEETGARVRAIALVHEQIYRTASPSVIELDTFLAQLVQQLAASMIGGTANITTDFEPVTIGLDRAVPVAILATEAITNAIKHGLEEGQGTIALSLHTRDGRNLLAVRDSGAGPTEEMKGGLGTRIMTALSRQIDGEWSLRAVPGEGTCFSLSWPAGN